jgi:hypothetical protein
MPAYPSSRKRYREELPDGHRTVSKGVREAGGSGYKEGSRKPLAELDRLNPRLLRQHRLVLPNLADHRLGRVPLTVHIWALWGTQEEQRGPTSRPLSPYPV